MTVFVTYFRVSTQKQSDSGLGLEAQQDAVKRFLRTDDKVVSSFTEVESGKNCNRPQLTAAMNECRRLGAKLLIAKIDRLARDVAFIANLMKSDIRFVAADMPDADPFRLHLEAAIAEEEARKISARTKAALAAARTRGVVLGGYRGTPPTATSRNAANVARKAKAITHAIGLVQVINDIRANGITSAHAIANELSKRNILTPRGSTTWPPAKSFAW